MDQVVSQGLVVKRNDMGYEKEDFVAGVTEMRQSLPS